MLQSLSRWERLSLGVLFAAFLVLGIITELRAAFLETRKGDLEVYLWTAYAVRTGDDIYDVIDHNGWHYLYPPLFAILMVPFAEKPPADPVDLPTLPFPVTVAIWYVLNLGLLLWAIHNLAKALEEKSTDPTVRVQPAGSWRWWALRAIPLWVCLVPIGHTLARGQVNLLVLTLITAAAAAAIRGRSWRSGLWLSGAICIKVIPAYLLLFPLWKRDWRVLGGCAAGLLIGLIAIPTAVFGPKQTIAYYGEWNDVFIQPALGRGTNTSRDNEVLDVTATHSQSFVAVIHNTIYPDPEKRPKKADDATRKAHLIIGAASTLLALAAAGWKRLQSGSATLLFFGTLMVLMILTSPVCHAHYFCMALPLVMGIVNASWESEPAGRVGVGWQLLFGLFVIGNALLPIPGLEKFRDLGVGLYPTLLLLIAANVFLFRHRKKQTAEQIERPEVRKRLAA